MAVKFSSDLMTLASDSDDEEADVPPTLTESESEHEEPSRPAKPTYIQKLLRAEAKRKRCADDEDVCCLDSAPPAKKSSNNGSPDKQAIRSPVRERTASHSSIPVRKLPVPMDPVLQAQRLRAAQELEALRRDDALVFSQTDSDVDIAHDPGGLQAGAEEGGPSGDGQLEDSEHEDEEQEQKDAENETEGKIILKIKSSLHTEGLKMRIGVTQPLHRLFIKYQERGHKEGWLPEGAKVTFKFDGDTMKGDNTPESLDMEDEDVIDACW